MADDDKTADTPKPHEPKSHDPESHDPESHDPESHEPKSDEPKLHEPESHQPESDALTSDALKPVESAHEADKGAGDELGARPPVSSHPHPVRPGSEWTASDDRGPLGRAEDEEREAAFSAQPPAHESDPISTGHAEPAPVPDLAGLMPSSPGEPIPPVDAIASASAPGAEGPRPPSGLASSTAGPPAAAEPGKRSLWPVAAALILGAVIGAGSAAFVYRGYADDSQPDPAVASLQTRVDALEKRPDSQTAINSLKSSVTALDNQVAGLRQGAGKTSTATSTSAPAPSAAAPAPDLGPLNDKIAALQSRLDGLKASGADTKALEEKIAALDGAVAGMKSATDSARAGVSSVESQQKAIEGQQKALAGKVMVPALAVVADSLVQQIDRGQPYEAQVDALTALGADPAKVAILRQDAGKGVPSAAALAARFEPLAAPITGTAHKAPPNAGFVDRLKSGMLSMVSVRRADDTSGTDLPSRVARIRVALAQDNVAGALDAWNALPPDAKAKAEAWGALAKSHVDAMAAARALQHDAIAALASSKS